MNTHNIGLNEKMMKVIFYFHGIDLLSVCLKVRKENEEINV